MRRGESSWLCMKFEFAFFSGHGILIRVLPPSSFLALTVNKICLVCLPDSVDRVESESIIDLWLFVAPEYSIE